ncbi:MAG: GMC family oxidoreductase, partial [Synechococcales cyanobacterium RM1_1_8]|nr:GMC family oxidoreductase [Synechococcales cyanobacterium RM1_1_8]
DPSELGQSPSPTASHPEAFSLHRPTPEQPWPPSSSQGAALKAALATGNVTLQSGAVVSHLILDNDSPKAKGVAYIEREGKQPREAFAKTIFLCASAIESTRILLHSTTPYQPNGLANKSDCLGRYLMDHVSTTQFFHWPNSPLAERTQEMSGSHSFFVPCFVNLGEQTENFKRGYGIWGGVQRFDMPSLVKKVGKGAIGFLIAHGEVLPRPENRVTLSPSTDAWGIPIPHIDCAWGDNEINMLAHMHDQIESLVQLVGGQCLSLNELFHIPVLSEYVKRLEKTMSFSAPPGFYIHEVGGAAMGSSPSNSVVNAHNQLWESPNVFVTDGACWPSSGWQSPTLTEMAVTARACEFAAIALQRGQL